ncbi:MAG: hypothetical protein WCO60_20165 [Verrucomicrobiota bacterium]
MGSLFPPDSTTPADFAAPASIPATVIAKAWGTSRAYVYKCLKRGCPDHSIEAATEWRSATAVHAVGSKGKQPAASISGSGHDEDSDSDETSGHDDEPSTGKSGGKRVRLRTIEASLKRAIANEELCAQAVDAARGFPAQLLVLINAYNKAQANRMETEKVLLKIQQERRDLISIDDAKDMMARAWLPLLARLRSAPKRAAAKANPSDDVLAELVFAEEIEAAIAEGQASYAEAIPE